MPTHHATISAAKALTSTFGTGILIQFLTLVSGVIVARSLGPTGRGLFAGAQVWPILFSGLGLCGVNFALTLRTARSRSTWLIQAKRGTAFAIVSSALATLGALLAITFCTPSGAEELGHLSLVYLPFIPLNLLTTVILAADHGRSAFHRYNTTRIALPLTFTIAVIALSVSEHLTPRWYLIANLAANATALSFRLASDSTHTLWPTFDYNQLIKLIHEGRPFFLSGAVQLVQTQIDRLFLIWLLPPRDLGLYLAALTAATAHSTLSESVKLVVFARGAALPASDAMHNVAGVYRIMVLVGFLAVLPLAVVLPWLITTVYGNQFADATPIAFAILPGQFASSAAQILDEGFRSQARPITGMKARLLGHVGFALAALSLYRPLGPLGVAIAMTLNHIIYLAFLLRSFVAVYPDSLIPGRSDLTRIKTTTYIFLGTLFTKRVCAESR